VIFRLAASVQRFAEALLVGAQPLRLLAQASFFACESRLGLFQ